MHHEDLPTYRSGEYDRSYLWEVQGAIQKTQDKGEA